MFTEYDCSRTEANWQFEVCFNLRLAEIPFEIEKSLSVGRVDIAISQNDRLFGIIEVKRFKPSREKSGQVARYEALNAPVHITYPGDNIFLLVKKCLYWVERGGVAIQKFDRRHSIKADRSDYKYTRISVNDFKRR